MSIVPATVDGVARSMFIDGGASLSCLHPRVAAEQRLEVHTGQTERCVSWFGQQRSTDQYVVTAIAAGEFEAVVCLPLLETPSGCDIVLGKNLLSMHHVTEDHATGRLTSRGRVLFEGTRQAALNVTAPKTVAKTTSPHGPSPFSPNTPTPEAGPSPTAAASDPAVAAARTKAKGTAPKPAAPAPIAPPATGGRYALRPRRADALFVRDDDDPAPLNTLYEMEHLRAWQRAGAVEEIFTVHANEIAEGPALLGSLGIRDAEEAKSLEARLLSRFADRFKTTLDHCPPLRHRNFSVDVTDDDPLPHRPSYGTTPEGRAALLQIVQEMARSGLIRRHSGPASCPIFLVKKKTLPGQPPRWRAVLDARPRNAKTRQQPFTPPPMRDLLSRLCHGKVLSQLDATSAYFQVRIEPDQENMFTFADPEGRRWAMRVMTMGATNAMATLYDIVSDIFHDFIAAEELIFYADDWVLVSQDVPSHYKLLVRFMERCEKHDFVLHPEKSRLFVSSVDFLGHRIEGGHATPLVDKVEAITSWPQPKRRTDLRAFLGTANYYAHYIPNYRAVVAPLDRLTGKGAFLWTEACSAAFDEVKRLLTSAPVLMLPDLSLRQFTLRADASDFALGAVLEQTREGKSHPVAYYCSPIEGSDRNLHIRVKELMSICMCLQKYEHWLVGAIIDVYTDHESLVQLGKACRVTPKILRCLDTLQMFDLRWHYIPGADNHVADGLSRRADLAPDANLDDHRQAIFNDYLRAAHLQATASNERVPQRSLGGTIFDEPPRAGRSATGYDISVLAALMPDPGTVSVSPAPDFATVARAAYATDEFFGPIVQLLRTGATASHLDLHANYYLAAGLLYRDSVVSGPQLCVPVGEALNLILHAAHNAAGHLGISKTVTNLKRFFFPRLRRTVQAYIAGCDDCQRNKAIHRRPAGLYTPLHIPTRPWTHISIDVVSGLPTVYEKFDAILTIVCRYTKMVIAVPISKTIDAEGVVDVLLQHVYARTGPILSIVSDRGSQFTSVLFRQLWERVGTKLNFSTAYHPQSDGQTEVYNRVLLSMLRTNLNDGDCNWVDVLPCLMYQLNSTVHDALQCSPYEADYGREPMQLWDALNSEHAPAPTDPSPAESREALDRMIRGALEEAQRKTKIIADAKRRPAPHIKVGDRVRVASTSLLSQAERLLFDHQKLRAKRIGPYRVLAVNANNTVVLDLPPAMRAHSAINVCNVTPYTPTDSFGRVDEPPPLMVTATGDYFAPESILRHRELSPRNGTPQFQYYIKWAGYSNEHNSWLTPDDLHLCRSLLDGYWQGLQKVPPKRALPSAPPA